MIALEVRARSLAAAALLLSSVGCGSGDPALGEPAKPVGEPSAPSGPCNVVTQAFEVTTASHVDECSVLPEAHTPPSGGDHYRVWPAFRSYDFPVPHGYLIHAMEHGALVFYYNCEDCAEEVAQVSAWLDARPEDPLCLGTGALRRVVLTPDPTLYARWAIGAWEHTLRADCFDPQAFETFYQAHYGQGPERLCAPGAAFDAPPCE